jgi:holo-[acyl-carrier protein] synthase
LPRRSARTTTWAARAAGCGTTRTAGRPPADRGTLCGVIVGVGIDVVAISRFARALQRTPALAERAFTPQERVTPRGGARSAESLAARFAAKEAVAKALGAPGNLRWHDAEITVAEHGRPVLVVRGTVAARARELGVTRWHLSMSHDAGIASAVVMAEAVAADPAANAVAGPAAEGGSR